MRELLCPRERKCLERTLSLGCPKHYYVFLPFSLDSTLGSNSETNRSGNLPSVARGRRELVRVHASAVIKCVSDTALNLLHLQNKSMVAAEAAAARRRRVPWAGGSVERIRFTEIPNVGHVMCIRTWRLRKTCRIRS